MATRKARPIQPAPSRNCGSGRMRPRLLRKTSPCACTVNGQPNSRATTTSRKRPLRTPANPDSVRPRSSGNTRAPSTAIAYPARMANTINAAGSQLSGPKASIGNARGIPRSRHRLEHGVVPEIKLQKQRQVTDHLDIDRRDGRHEPVLRQTRHADDEAKDCRKDNADSRDEQRVEQADPEGAAIGRGRAVGDQRLVDVEAGSDAEKAEAGGDLLRAQVLDGVGGRLVDEESDDEDQRELIDDPTNLGIVEKRGPLRFRRSRNRRLPDSLAALHGVTPLNPHRRTAAIPLPQGKSHAGFTAGDASGPSSPVRRARPMDALRCRRVGMAIPPLA